MRDSEVLNFNLGSDVPPEFESGINPTRRTFTFSVTHKVSQMAHNHT